MLSHLSEKFKASPSGEHEPRAALILNRFTQTSSILYATRSLNEILGFELDQAVGMSFYQCIQPDCLEDAISAIERAKENDSIAYLRFNWRYPSPLADNGQDNDEAEAHGDVPYRRRGGRQSPLAESAGGGGVVRAGGRSGEAASAASSRRPSVEPTVELEAVVSCTSDGLVVVLRRARPIIPPPRHPELRSWLFVSPWAPAPVTPQRRPAAALNEPVGGPPAEYFMESIRQVGVFAWSLRSINENLLQYARPPASATRDSSDSSDGEKDPKRLKPNSSPGGHSPEYEQETARTGSSR
jgi:hypothetical protein